MGSTKIELVKDLESVLVTQNLTQTRANKIFKIISKAKKGEYHDFESMHAAPKINLHADLLDVPLDEIDRKMQNGAYHEESPSPEQEKEMADLLKK